MSANATVFCQVSEGYFWSLSNSLSKNIKIFYYCVFLCGDHVAERIAHF